MKLKGFLIIQWQNVVYIIITLHMLLLGPKDFREDNLELEQNTIILQSSVYHYTEELLQIKLTINEWWHVSQCQHMTLWHTTNTWKVNTSFRLKVNFQNRQKGETIVIFSTARLLNKKAMSYITRMMFVLVFELKDQLWWSKNGQNPLNWHKSFYWRPLTPTLPLNHCIIQLPPSLIYHKLHSI